MNNFNHHRMLHKLDVMKAQRDIAVEAVKKMTEALTSINYEPSMRAGVAAIGTKAMADIHEIIKRPSLINEPQSAPAEAK